MRNATILLAVVVMLAVSAQATEYYWAGPTGADQDYMTATNWSGGAVPIYSSANNVYIGNYVGATNVCKVTSNPNPGGGAPNNNPYKLYVGKSDASTDAAGRIEVSADYLYARYTYIRPDGVVTHIGGTYSGGSGFNVQGGQYTLNNAAGTLAGGAVWVSGSGTVNQSAGLLKATIAMGLATRYANDNCAYNLSGGEAIIKGLKLGTSYTSANMSAAWNITNTPRILITDSLQLGTHATLSYNKVVRLTAPTGTNIYMTGSTFENRLLDSGAETGAANVAGLNNITLTYTGGTVDLDNFEVAGEDVGCLSAGLVENFALEGLTLGGDALDGNGARIGQIKLVDVYDNQADGAGNEVLYVENLVIGTGSTLDLAGLKLVYLSGASYSIGDGMVLDSVGGGSICQIPEPATMVLLGIGGIGVLLRRRRK